MLYSLIVIVGIISYILDLKYNIHFKKCKSNSIFFHLLLLFHHILAVYIIFGIFSKTKNSLKIYVSVLGIILLSWYLYGDKCLITYYTNKICNIPTETPFSSIFGKLYHLLLGNTKDSKEKQKNILEYILIPSLIFISFYKISKVK
jgi:hypothetical protein